MKKINPEDYLSQFIEEFTKMPEYEKDPVKFSEMFNNVAKVLKVYGNLYNEHKYMSNDLQDIFPILINLVSHGHSLELSLNHALTPLLCRQFIKNGFSEVYNDDDITILSIEVTPENIIRKD